MAVNSVTAPYFAFADTAGKPLEAGYIYIGQPGLEAQSSPKASFFDAALTIPTGTATGAAVRTSGGYPVRNGSAAQIYVDGDYSTTVRDKSGVLIFSRLNRAIQVGIETTSNGLFGDGNLAGVGIGFGAEPTTGLIRSATNEMRGVVGGNPIWQATASAFSLFTPLAVASGGTGVAVVETAATDVTTAIPNSRALFRGRGYTFSSAQATTSGTAFDFTGIPSWATEILVQFFGVSLSGTDSLAVQFGVSGSVVATGYVGSSGAINLTACSAINGTGAFVLLAANASFAVSGEMRLSQVFANGWVQSHSAHITPNAISTGGGSINLAGPPDRIRLTRTGTDTFDAGSVRVGYR